MPDYSPRVDDYVSFGDDHKYGRVTALDNDKNTATLIDADGKTQTEAYGKIQQSVAARLRMKAQPNAIEMAENVVFMTLYNKAVAGRSVTSAENVSFLIAEILHEFLLKGTLSNWFDFMKEPVLEKDADSFFQTSDFVQDPARRLPVIFVLQQLIQKLMYKKQFSHGAMHNLLGGWAALSVSNVADRMFNAEKGKKYRYP